MRYTHTTSILISQRELEETDLPCGSFVGRYTKGFRRFALIAALLAIGLTYFLLLGIRNSAAGYAFLIPGAAMLLLLPEIYTYRCRVTADSVTVSRRIVFYPYQKEVQWTDVAYKRVKRGKSGAILFLRLYDAQKKRLLSVDALVVGIERMVKRVRNVPKLEK